MTGPSPAPRAVLVIGPAGSGKSTVATAVARRLGAAYLDKDTLCGPFVGALLGALGEDPHARESSAIYLGSVMDLEYGVLFDVAADNLHLGTDVVIDAPFAGRLRAPDFLTRMRAGARWPPADVVVVTVRASPAAARARLVERGLDRDRVKLAHWDEFWAEHGSVRCAWTGVTTVEVTNDRQPDLAPLEAVLGS